MEIIGNKNSKIVANKIANKYTCNLCDYNTCNKYDFNKHLSTRKHQMEINGKNVNKKNRNNRKEINEKTTCIHCNKIYMSQSGLWKHLKKCQDKLDKELINSNIVLEKENKELSNPNIELEKENKELKEIIKDQNYNILKILKQTDELKELINNNSIITNNNNTTNNNHFNINVFLNEKCKDAINMSDFLDSLKIELKDLEYVGKNGYVEGITNIFVKNLNELDLYKRPLHCTDKKRDVFYIKDEE